MNDPTTSWHTTLPTALGELTLVRDADAVTGLYFPHHWYRPSRATFGPRDDRGFDHVVAELQEYLAGRRQRFTVPVRADGDPLRQRVWSLLADVPYGHTTTYGAIAAHLDGVDAQQVGAAIGRNPLCILVPCHRVIGSSGKLTGYAGGLARKRLLLDLERANRPAAEPAEAFETAGPLEAAGRAGLTGPYAAAFTW
jgi:methylated-DNA-[protein]-cysteine S-methyltransferase